MAFAEKHQLLTWVHELIKCRRKLGIPASTFVSVFALSIHPAATLRSRKDRTY
jgi:hypothetical protein